MRRDEKILEAVEAGDLERVRRILARDPAAARARTKKGVSALLLALYHGHDDVLAALRAARTRLDVFEASALGEAARVRQVLDRTPDAARRHSPDGFTPLHLASYFGRPEVASLLLERGADANAVAENEELAVTPLHSAAAGRRTEIVALLLDRGADPNARQNGGWTALHAAAANGDVTMVELLLARGADPEALSDDRTRPIEFAIERNHREIVGLLRGRSRGQAP